MLYRYFDFPFSLWYLVALAWGLPGGWLGVGWGLRGADPSQPSGNSLGVLTDSPFYIKGKYMESCCVGMNIRSKNNGKIICLFCSFPENFVGFVNQVRLDHELFCIRWMPKSFMYRF